MPRPKVPLISRRAALEAALTIIDDEGLDALSIRRLADELGVNGASLYHHFANKEEILVGAARLALAEVRTPETAGGEAWQIWMARNARRLRDALLTHPGIIPIVLRRGPLGIGTDMLESTAALLRKEGLALGKIVPLLEALEQFALSSAMHESSTGTAAEPGPDITVHDHPTLYGAASGRALGAGEIFDAVVRGIIDTVDRTAVT